MRAYGKMLLLIAVMLSITGTGLAAPKPGETAAPVQAQEAQQSIRIQMQSTLVFPSALASASAMIENPAESALAVSYTLQIAPDVFEKQTGRRPPEDAAIVLYVSGELAPGTRVDTITLAPLWDGTTLPEGTYDASMLVSPAMQAGDTIRQVYDVQISVVVMADEREAVAEPDGSVSLGLYNPLDTECRFALVMSMQALREQGGVALYAEGSVFSEADSMVIAAISGDVPSGMAGQMALCALPSGDALPAGEYSCWLMRITDGAYTGIAGVMLTVAVQNVSGETPVPFTQEEALAYAQAAVNAAYLLSL